jgi:hypothetical protein
MVFLTCVFYILVQTLKEEVLERDMFLIIGLSYLGLFVILTGLLDLGVLPLYILEDIVYLDEKAYDLMKYTGV